MKKDEEYIPFGDEWVKEMMKFPKADLIDLLKKALMENKDKSNRFDALSKVYIDLSDRYNEFISN